MPAGVNQAVEGDGSCLYRCRGISRQGITAVEIPELPKKKPGLKKARQQIDLSGGGRRRVLFFRQGAGGDFVLKSRDDIVDFEHTFIAFGSGAY
jgi:hypothetical protein